MRHTAGTFYLQSSSTDTYICVGYIPDWVKVYSSHSNEEMAHWSVHMMRHASTLSGISHDDDGAVSADTFETGIQVYRGGETITSANVTANKFYGKNDLDYSKDVNADSSTYDTIDKWNLTTGQTGYWNTECNTSYVGVGSRINIDGKWYVINALTSNGESSGEVTISESAVASGVIQCITYMYDYAVNAFSAGDISKAGFWIDETSDVLNATSEIAWFECGTYEN